MSAEDDIETAARALFHRDYAEANEPTPCEWDEMTEKSREIWREAVR